MFVGKLNYHSRYGKIKIVFKQSDILTANKRKS